MTSVYGCRSRFSRLDLPSIFAALSVSRTSFGFYGDAPRSKTPRMVISVPC